MLVPETARKRFHAVVADLQAAVGAVREIERQINGRREALFPLRAEIARLEPALTGHWLEPAEMAQRRVEQLRGEMAKRQAEVDRLIAEKDRLQRRYDAANQLACACRDFLMDKYNLSRAEVDF